MNEEDVSSLRKGHRVRMVKTKDGSTIPFGQIGVVLGVVSHEDFGGGFEVIVNWPHEGPGFMDPGDLERVGPDEKDSPPLPPKRATSIFTPSAPPTDEERAQLAAEYAADERGLDDQPWEAEAESNEPPVDHPLWNSEP